MIHCILRVLGHVLGIYYSHKWLFLVCLIATIAYVLVSPESYYVLPNSTKDFAFEHGWPAVYMIRVSDWGWGNWNSGLWLIHKGIRYFYFLPFFADIIVALGLSLLMVLLWHLHCASNQKPWLINIKEVLIVALVLGAVFVAIKKLHHKHDEEMAFLMELEKTGWEWYLSADALPWYLRPLKELGVINEEDYDYRQVVWPSNDLGSREELEEETDNINDVLARLAAERPPLTFVHSVGIADHRLDERGIQSLCKLFPCCTELYLSGFLEDSLPNITDREIAYITSHLRNLHGLGLHGTKLTDESVQRFATMRKLRDLGFDDRWKATTSAGLKPLLELPYILTLGIPGHWTVTAEERETIMRRGPAVDFMAPDENASEQSK